jgi:hypothetical protein
MDRSVHPVDLFYETSPSSHFVRGLGNDTMELGLQVVATPRRL